MKIPSNNWGCMMHKCNRCNIVIPVFRRKSDICPSCKGDMASIILSGRSEVKFMRDGQIITLLNSAK